MAKSCHRSPGCHRLGAACGEQYFIRRVEYFGQKLRSWKHWLKWLAVVDVERKIILAQSARQAPWNDCAILPVLVSQAHQHTPIGCVLAGAEFDSERNHTFCREQLKADSIIPAKRFTNRRATGVRQQMRENFPRQQYCRRSLIESVFPAVIAVLQLLYPETTPQSGFFLKKKPPSIESVRTYVLENRSKRKLSCRAPGKIIATQSRQALLLGLAFNLYRLWLPAIQTILLRMSTEPEAL